MRKYILIKFILLLSCCNDNEITNDLDGLWKPRVINKTGIDVKEQLKIIGLELELRYVLPDTLIVIPSKAKLITDEEGIPFFKTCIEYLNDESTVECFCFRKGKEDLLELWNCNYKDVVMTYERVLE